MIKILSKKSVGIIVTCVIVASIIGLSVFGAYNLGLNNSVEDPTSTNDTQPETEDKTPDPVEEIKQLVLNTINISVDSIGMKLQKFLQTAGADDFTEETFDTPYLSVKVIDAVQVKSGEVQRILCELYGNSKGSYKMTFLRYIGTDGSFAFSEAYKLSWNYNESLYFAAEITDGIFIFDVRLGASDKDYFKVNSGVYSVKNNKIEKIGDSSIPLMVAREGCKYEISENQGTISFQVIGDDYYDYGGDGDWQTVVAESIFDTTSLKFLSQTFKEVSHEIEENPNIENGLLLGLSDKEGNLRTLWIRPDDGKIVCSNINDEIIFLRNNKLYSLKNHKFDRGEEVIVSDNYSYFFYYNKLLCAPLGQDMTGVFNEFVNNAISNECTNKSYQIPLYIGDEYIYYVDNTKNIRPSFESSFDSLCFDKIDNLNKMQNSEKVSLMNMVYSKDEISWLKNEFDFDFNQLGIKRNEGKWYLTTPVMKYREERQSLNMLWVEDYIHISPNVPADLIKDSYDGFNELIDYRLGHSRDYFGYPDKFNNVHLYDYSLCIFDNAAMECKLAAPIKPDEHIVSINFASGKTISEWETALRDFTD